MSNPTYHLEVYGIVWAGFKTTYSYDVGSARAMILRGLERPTKLDAGDFNEILDWRLVEETNRFERSGLTSRPIYKFKTLRGFRNGMSPRRFYRLANGGGP